MERPVTFTNEGQQIIGILHIPGGDGKYPCVVLFHGFTGSKSEDHWLFVKLARKLCYSGFVVLRFDFRNSCDSEGEFEFMTISDEISDGLKAVDFLSEQECVDPNRIGILGLSLGGCVAACVAGRDKKVKSLVLWAPVGTPKDHFLTKAQSEGIEIDQFPVERGGLLIGHKFYEDLPNIQPFKEIRLVNGPVQIVSGNEDKTVPIRRSEEYQEILQEYGLRNERLLIEGADHTFSKVEHERMAIDEAVRWFRKTLRSSKE